MALRGGRQRWSVAQETCATLPGTMNYLNTEVDRVKLIRTRYSKSRVLLDTGSFWFGGVGGGAEVAIR